MKKKNKAPKTKAPASFVGHKRDLTPYQRCVLKRDGYVWTKTGCWVGFP